MFCQWEMQFSKWKPMALGPFGFPPVVGRSTHLSDALSFIWETKTPPASDLIKKILGIPSGSTTPNKVKVGALSQEQLREIAEKKLQDLNANDIDAAMSIIAGTARSMGVTIKEA